MTTFAYEARDASGRGHQGSVNAASADEATTRLRRDGKSVVSIAPAAAAVRGGRVKRDDVIYFASQLAVMVDSGVSLDEALGCIARQHENPAFAAVLQDVWEKVQSGAEFSKALADYPKIFDNLFVTLMRASEASGTMGQMLERAADYMQQERETRKRIKGAMMYPACMLSFCVLVVIGLLVFILPRFEKIYSGKGALLPLPTRALLAMSAFILSYWPFLIVSAGVAAGLIWWFVRTPGGTIFMDKLRISVPLLGRMYRKAYLARSLRTMATMVGTGVGVLEGLDIAAAIAGNSQYAKVWKDVAAAVQDGLPLSQPLQDSELVPGTIAQMVDAGERSGRLGMVMDRVAGFCEEELKVAVKSMTAMIEPIMIIVMGLIVGGVAMALLLPIFKLSKVVGH
ncbi:MAG: type II secretion system F family protein [Planctomycetaceae bacterium]|nr:type II secretion system F family protein [Planctomycetaceae bacterium]